MGQVELTKRGSCFSVCLYITKRSYLWSWNWQQFLGANLVSSCEKGVVEVVSPQLEAYPYVPVIGDCLVGD
jgi:hypothetical protein